MGLFFDKRDYQLLNIVNEVRSRKSSLLHAKKVFYPYFHPHGIKEMSESKGLRIAYAVVYLLASLEAGKIDDRLVALRTLRDEALSVPESPFIKNTARVLLEVMKELVRSHGDRRRQLELAHDFRTAAAGKPRTIRALLRRYHLLELPEEWNQIVFDDHVHDVNTKGRKSPTHLIMDAWIKGIRRLRVIHYNYVNHRSASELLEAAQIMGIDVRIGIEYPARYRDRYAHLIWVPRDFSDPQAFLLFLEEPAAAKMMAEGRRVTEYQESHVFTMLREFNDARRRRLCADFEVDLPHLDLNAFLSFVGAGQASLVHLGQFIQERFHEAFRIRLDALRLEYHSADDERRARIDALVDEANRIDWEAIVDRYLSPDAGRSVHDHCVAGKESGVPELICLPPGEMAQRLAGLRSAFRLTLNLSNLRVEDVLEILYDCEGLVTRLEIFNLKDHTAGKTDHIPEINELQQALNQGNVIKLKRLILRIINRVKASDRPDAADRTEKLYDILHDTYILKDLYRVTPLKSRIGSDSTGRSPRVPGMGLGLYKTLPARARREVRQSRDSKYPFIPFRIVVHPRITYVPFPADAFFSRLLNRFGFHQKRKDWDVQEYATVMQKHGNIISLGGVHAEDGGPFTLTPPRKKKRRKRASVRYMKTWLKNALKVLLGFIPAFTSFVLAHDWWVLQYLGAFIWFGITGLRNILQSVFGGGGVRRSPLMRWNDYVSWDRLTDSLLFTGFSVPLLDVLVKTVILDRGLGITTTTHAIELYALMALANGVYISSHNILRGLPRGAIYGNLFRSLLSIPLAVGFNYIAAGLLTFIGVAGVNVILQKWAAVISKLASDCVAGIIEGAADRFNNIRLRKRDYSTKISQLFDAYSRLELMLPEIQVMDRLTRADAPKPEINKEAADMEKIIMIHSLDLLYFWMYQPRSRSALRWMLRNMSEDERELFIRSQFVLRRHTEISQMFIDGLISRNFMKALAFYLDRSEDYLRHLHKAAAAYSFMEPDEWA